MRCEPAYSLQSVVIARLPWSKQVCTAQYKHLFRTVKTTAVHKGLTTYNYYLDSVLCMFIMYWSAQSRSMWILPEKSFSFSLSFSLLPLLSAWHWACAEQLSEPARALLDNMFQISELPPCTTEGISETLYCECCQSLQSASQCHIPP